ncbi:MAG: efflux RND transporter periplasmic adaptor subunit [Methyloprofundus sp.]|nr:efflux RND transporter periplasmic adaptor subunit [Methyloprofundus sp.]
MDKPLFKYINLKWLPAVLIIIAALSLSVYFLSNKPKSKSKPLQIKAPLVKVLTSKVINHQITIRAMGTVIPAKQVNLTSRINGMVTAVSPNFIPGSFLKKGERIVQLDPTDYALAIKQKENELAKAQFNLTLEEGQQAIAEREFKLLNANLDEQSQALVLRKPHLLLAKSNVDAAKAALQQARLNLRRTKTVSPFNAVVLSTNAHIGSWVSTFSTGTPLIKLAGTDHVWVIATLPVSDLSKITLPSTTSKQGSTAKIFYPGAWGSKLYRVGKIKRVKAALETSGRMAEVIIEINDPFNLHTNDSNTPPIILDSFVNIQIAAKLLKGVIEIPETALQSDNTIWLFSNKNTLAIKKISPLWKEKGKVFIAASSLPVASKIIISALNTPVSGMALRLENHAR